MVLSSNSKTPVLKTGYVGASPTSTYYKVYYYL
jgi:hypothetical protein